MCARAPLDLHTIETESEVDREVNERESGQWERQRARWRERSMREREVNEREREVNERERGQ